MQRLIVLFGSVAAYGIPGGGRRIGQRLLWVNILVELHRCRVAVVLSERGMRIPHLGCLRTWLMWLEHRPSPRVVCLFYVLPIQLWSWGNRHILLGLLWLLRGHLLSREYLRAHGRHLALWSLRCASFGGVCLLRVSWSLIVKLLGCANSTFFHLFYWIVLYLLASYSIYNSSNNQVVIYY